MVAQQSHSTPQPQQVPGGSYFHPPRYETREMPALPPLLGMGLAALALLCTTIGALRGANLLLTLLVDLLSLRLLALCYGSYLASKRKSHLPAYAQGYAVNPPSIPATSAAFASLNNNTNNNIDSFIDNATSIAPPASPFLVGQVSEKQRFQVLRPQQGQFLAPAAHAMMLGTSNIANVPYIPIEQDELFQLDLPMLDEYVLYLPKEGEALVECQDRFALDGRRGRYAIADGVSSSFAPGPWARIVARGFVEYTLNAQSVVTPGQGEQASSYSFGDRAHFEHWLHQCRNAWYQWMRERWVPTMNALHAHQGGNAINWESEIEHGAQTTLTGCCLHPRTNPADPYIDVTVSIFGDSEFFIFRRDERGAWQNVAAYPFTTTAEFNAYPTVLATRPQAELVEYAWSQSHEYRVSALPGDHIILATDALAKWILTQLQQQNAAWTILLDSTDSALHEQLLRHEQRENRIEDDDLTMLVIPISAYRRG